MAYLLMVVAAFVLIYLNRRLHSVANDSWLRTARELSLNFESKGLMGQLSMTGRRGAFDVRAETFYKSSGDTRETWTRVGVVHAEDRIPRQLELKGEGAWSGLKKVFTGEDVLLGDKLFDEVVHVTGQEEVAVAVLGREARSAVMRLVCELDGKVKDGCVQLERKGVMRPESELGDALRALVSVAQCLVLDSVSGALRANALQDPDPGTRLRNLQLLVEKFSGAQDTNRALEGALLDPAAEIRLLAAARIGSARALPVLAALVEDRAAAEEVRVAALEKLLAQFDYPKAAPSVAAALAAQGDRLRRAALSGIAVACDASFLQTIIALAAGAPGPVAEAAAKALGNFGDARAESVLLQLLKRDSVEVQRAAAAALGLVGTVRAVEPLLLLTQGLLADARCKELARDAVRRIQGRLGDAAAGQLSLTEHADQAGGLSVAPGGGELSIAPSDKVRE
jgi:HEAT repeat protein